MYFDYRIVKKKYPRNEDGSFNSESDSGPIYHYGIFEVYYDMNGKACMVCQEAESLSSEDVNLLIERWVMITEAFTKPILDFDEIPEDGANNFIEERVESLNDQDISNYKSFDEVKEEFGFGDFNYEEYRKEQEQKKLDEEEKYNSMFLNKDQKYVVNHIIKNYFNRED